MYTFSNVKCGLIIIAAVTMGLFALGMVYAFKRGNVTIYSPDSMILYSDQSLPASFYFSVEYDTPQQSINDEWISSTIDYIESTYRSFGIRSGYLNSDLYLKFDSNFYTKVLNFYCKEIGNGCPPQKELFVASSFPKIFENVVDLTHLFVHHKYCDSADCTDISKVILNNPLVLEYIDYNWAITVSDIKQLLSESEQPLLMTIPYPYIKYIIPCDDHRANCTSDSKIDEFSIKKKIFSCPNWIDSNKKCTYLSFPAELSNAEFYKPQFPALIDFGNPLTFLLYGWNDDFVTKASNSMSQLKTVQISRGGFIVKRPLKQKGNSLNLYDGSLLFNENDKICGSPYDVQRWGKDDILICINSSLCDTRYNYSLFVQENGEHVINSDLYGISVTKMNRWNEKVNETFDYDQIPYQNLDLAFKLAKNQNNRSFNSNICGYWFLPYDIIEQADSIVNSTAKKVHAINVAVKWTKGSYPKKSEGEPQFKKIVTRDETIIDPLPS